MPTGAQRARSRAAAARRARRASRGRGSRGRGRGRGTTSRRRRNEALGIPSVPRGEPVAVKRASAKRRKTITPLSKYQRAMLKAFPRGTRTAPRLLKLWKEAQGMGVAANSKWARRKNSVQNKDEVRRVDLAYKRWSVRMKRYGAILRRPSSHGAIPAQVVKGLLLSPGKGTHVADAIWPLSFGNQTQVLLDHERQRYVQLFDDLREEALVMLDDAKKAGNAIANNAWKIGVAVIASVVGGVIVAKVVD